MRDISAKQITLRTAVATGLVLCSREAFDMIKAGKIPKGNIFDFAKAAGLLAAKNTHNLIPHCHPVTIDGLQITFDYLEPGAESDQGLKDKFGVRIKVEAKSIGRTGIEMEALTAVSVCALTIYDLLKPVDNKELEITSIKLNEKTGGKSDLVKYINKGYKAAILVCSDSTAAGKRVDNSGKKIEEMLRSFHAEIADYKVIPDNKTMIQQQILEWVEKDIPFIFTTGGTGLGPRDHTVDAVQEIIEREAHGITEAMRVYGGMRTPLAMMSRSVAGAIGETLIVTLPGSTNGVRECLEAILPSVFHARSMMKGGGH
jgi:molybdenum cofactor biosynthesis protein MoaC